MKQVILVRYGEIFLKGKNFIFFEKTLMDNIRRKIKPFNVKLEYTSGRFIISNFEANVLDSIIETLQTVFGLISLSVASEIETSLENIKEECKKIKIKTETFKVETKRADKNFPVRSYELSSILGGIILNGNPQVKVDVHLPQTTVQIDIRHNGKTYIYYDKIACLGGMPVGTAGKSLLLLSGGIDSPVSAYMMAKRGVSINAIHFHSYPYTSLQAKEKVISLANIIKKYTGSFNLIVVPFTKIQEEIHKNCNSNYMVILVRRFMMKIAEIIANKFDCNSLTTGESLGQVASQTVESITITNNAIKMLPVFRPLIAFDKVEIMDIAKKIGTYETSILPYEDCCSVFLPESPVTKPKLNKILENESFLNIDELINNAVENIEIIKVF